MERAAGAWWLIRAALHTSYPPFSWRGSDLESFHFMLCDPDFLRHSHSHPALSGGLWEEMRRGTHCRDVLRTRARTDPPASSEPLKTWEVIGLVVVFPIALICRSTLQQ